LKDFKEKVTLIEGRASSIHRVKGDVKGVFHLGIYSSSPMYRENRKLVAEVVEDMIAILDFCREKGCKLVFASTSSIYNGNPVPWREDMPIYVTDFYTEARYYCERLAQLYGQLYDVKSVGLRLFSVYGEREEYKGRFANVVTQMLWAKLKGEEFVIYGDGNQTRDFVYVKDVVRAFLLAMEKDVVGIFNVGFGKAYSFNEVADLVEVRTRKVENPIKNYVRYTLADTKKAEEVLGFKASVPLEKGIAKIEEYYEKAVQEGRI